MTPPDPDRDARGPTADGDAHDGASGEAVSGRTDSRPEVAAAAAGDPEAAVPGRADPELEATGPADSEAPPQANPAARRRRPRPDEDPLGFAWASVVMGWRWLTRMRTALYILAVLGLATLVATVVPQEPNVPSTVADWRSGEEGPGAWVADLIDLVGGFDMYGSPAFLALLLLLYLSLTACLIPRITAWVRLVRRSQPPRSRQPARQQQVTAFVTDRPADEVLERARAQLGRRWRVRAGAPDDGPGPAQVAAERGLWSREGGSLLFHLSFYVLVLAIVFGQLLTFEGQVGVVEGDAPGGGSLGFADTPVSYWSYRPGRWWGDEDHAGWTLSLDEFHVDWVRDPNAPAAGQPTTFESDVTVTHADGEVTETTIAGNAPGTFDGMKVHQLDWGYAPRLVVEQDGEVVFDDFLNAAPNDAGFFRSAVKAPAADPDLGLDVFLYPFAPEGEDGPQLTGAPWAEAPLIIAAEYRGDLRLGETQQTIGELDTTLLDRVGGALLRPGDEVELSGGATVRFPELRRWVGFQVSRRPQLPWLLLGGALMVAGLVPAIYAYRRRLWVSATPDGGDGRTLVTVAGRAFQRPQAFESEHAETAERLRAAVDGRPQQDADAETDAPGRGDEVETR